jgi:hypothetical protein
VNRVSAKLAWLFNPLDQPGPLSGGEVTIVARACLDAIEKLKTR